MAGEKAKSKKDKAKKPITYYYNPYYKNETELNFLEVWQVLEDDVLGSLYPWQYTPTAETSNRIVTLNFLALKNFEKDYRKYFDQIFIYKTSAKLLAEGNVHRLGSILQPNLILCFDVFQLEKYGDKAALAGLKFLVSIGATIMLEGVDKAPVDVLLKYPASYFLLDYRYYSQANKGLLTMMQQITKSNGITMVVANVKDKENLDIFKENGIEIFSGSGIKRPKKKISAFVDMAQEEVVDTKKTYIVQAEDSPTIKDKDDKVETVTIEISTQRDEFKARLAASAAARKKAKEEEAARKAQEEAEALRKQKELELEEARRKAEEEKQKIKNLKAGEVSTSNDEFASLSKNKDNKNREIVRGANVIKLNIARPTKSRRK